MKRWDQVRPEVAQRLMAALDAYQACKNLAIQNHGAVGIELMSCLEMARAEAAPKLRTRAEVDAEIVSAVRGGDFSCSRLEKLCAEPLAPEPEAKQPGPRYVCADDCTSPRCPAKPQPTAHAKEEGWADPEPEDDRIPDPDPCSCEEALALRKRLGDVLRFLTRVELDIGHARERFR